MRRIPNFHGLRAFEAAARLGSFLLASQELHLTPSAVSHQIRALEAYFGRPLFVRQYRQVQLTEEGKRLFERLYEALERIEAACAELSPNSAEEQRLSLHCAPSFASKWLGPRLPSFMREHPTINLHLASSADPIDLARRDEFDMNIAYGSLVPSRGVVFEPLGTESVAALAAPAVAARYDPADSSPHRHPVTDRRLATLCAALGRLRLPPRR